VTCVTINWTNRRYHNYLFDGIIWIMAGEFTEVSFLEVGNDYRSVARPVRLGHKQPVVEEEPYLDRLDEINETFRALGNGTHRAEIALVNQDSASRELVLFPSTALSSLTQNAGNAIELAARGAANPNTAYLYVAFPGNGLSYSFEPAEQWYRARTGRLTNGGGERGSPYYYLPTINGISRLLIRESLVPNHVSADESGGRLGLALMAALDKGTIKDAYFNGIPGISSRASYAKEMAGEDVKSRIKRRGISEGQPGEITPDRIKEAKARLPKVYKSLGQRANRLTSITIRNWFYNFPPNLRFGAHDDLSMPAQHGAIQDTLAALSRQEAMITFQFNQASRLHDREDCEKFGQKIMDLIPLDERSPKRGVRILFGEGTLDQHTEQPLMRMMAERLALNDIA
jgi:hypothetical protein